MVRLLLNDMNIKTNENKKSKNDWKRPTRKRAESAVLLLLLLLLCDDDDDIFCEYECEYEYAFVIANRLICDADFQFNNNSATIIRQHYS